MRKVAILMRPFPLLFFSFLRNLVVYVCTATVNAEMTNLIVNYLVN